MLKLNAYFRRSSYGGGLRSRATRGAFWTVGGYGLQQVFRLGSNLVLTRLLFPEAFALMAIAQVFLTGLVMLSDIGVGPSVIQNKRGSDPNFLATAWTMQIIRGGMLFVLMMGLAFPVAWLYDKPVLAPMLIWIGLTAIFQGFQSIGLITAGRQIALRQLTLIDLLSQVAGIVTMVCWAWKWPSVWALVGGGLVASACKLLFSHLLLPSQGNRFHFEKDAAGEIFRFGRWIFWGTVFTYLGGEGLRLVQGYLLPWDVLGVFVVAGHLAWAAGLLTHKIGSSVLFPAFAEIRRDRPEQLKDRLFEARHKLFWITAPIFTVLILFGRELVTWLYDSRYHDAGLFLVILSVSAAVAAMRTPFGMVLLSVGDSFGHAVITIASTATRLWAMVVGFAVGEVVGMLVGLALSQLMVYPLEAWRLQRQTLWYAKFDLMVFMYYLVLGGVSWWGGPFLITDL